MKTTFYKAFLTENNNYIKVPRLQRDYVQGTNLGIKTSFCQNIISAVENGELMDLNFVYGLHESCFFIPIDGQQRLTTLWILHLYILSRSQVNFRMCSLQYTTRDSAKQFCKATRIHFSEICNSEQLDIQNQRWYFDSWNKDTTVMGIIATLNYFHNAWLHKDKVFFEEKWKLLCSDDCPITFTFINNREEELNRNIYLKMNSRGRTLSEYEKLKSWLDERLPKEEEEKEFWRSKIDNEWTEMIWKKRIVVKSVTGEKIDNIDVEQLRLMYNIIATYWTFNLSDNRESRAQIIDIENLDQVIELLQFSLTKKTDAGIKIPDFQRSLIAKMVVNNNFSIPLYILDKINLAPADFFQKASIWYNNIYKYYLNLEQLKDLLSVGDDGVFYKYFLDTNHTYPDAVIFIAILLYMNSEKPFWDNSNDENFKDWIRVVRNIVTNSTIDTVVTYLGAVNLIKELSVCLNAEYEYNIYCFLAKKKSVASDFAKEQIKEEIFKALIIHNECKEQDKLVKESLHKMEDLSFFKGKIFFAFYCIDIDIRDVDYQESSFAKCQALFNSVYEVIKESISNRPDNDITYDFRRILFSCRDHRFYQYYTTPSYSLGLDKRIAIMNVDDLYAFKTNNAWIDYLKEAIRLIVQFGSEDKAVKYVQSKNYDGAPNWIIRLIKEDNLLSTYCTKKHFFAVEENDSACYLFKGAQRPRDKSDCFRVE